MPDDSLEILVVDDEAELRESLSQLFSREGHNVTAVEDGDRAIGAASANRFDVVLLDVALGHGLAGYDVCRILRQRGNLVPIVILTALDSEADAVLALESGADDYVRKPFGPGELRSRVRAVLRRGAMLTSGEDTITVGRLSLDLNRRLVTVDGREVALTFSEYELLFALLREPGRVFDRHELLSVIWGSSAYRDPRAIDVHVRHLRQKLEDEPENPRLIVTVRSKGYKSVAF